MWVHLRGRNRMRAGWLRLALLVVVFLTASAGYARAQRPPASLVAQLARAECHPVTPRCRASIRRRLHPLSAIDLGSVLPPRTSLGDAYTLDLNIARKNATLVEWDVPSGYYGGVVAWGCAYQADAMVGTRIVMLSVDVPGIVAPNHLLNIPMSANITASQTWLVTFSVNVQTISLTTSLLATVQIPLLLFPPLSAIMLRGVGAPLGAFDTFQTPTYAKVVLVPTGADPPGRVLAGGSALQPDEFAQLGR